MLYDTDDGWIELLSFRKLFVSSLQLFVDAVEVRLYLQVEVILQFEGVFVYLSIETVKELRDTTTTTAQQQQKAAAERQGRCYIRQDNNKTVGWKVGWLDDAVYNLRYKQCYRRHAVGRELGR